MILRLTFLVPLIALALASPALGMDNELSFNPPRCAETSSEIVVRGNVNATGNVTLVLRVDDDRSSGYASRANLERVVPPGPFTWQVPLQGMRTSGGEPLETCALKLITVFVGAGTATLELTALEITKTLSPQGDVIAFDLGPVGSPLFPGFEPMPPTHPALKGSSLNAIRRPGPDALIADGISGIQSVYLDVPPGDWKVTLWTEDPGEWETLPHPFSRTIEINNTAILKEEKSPHEWMLSRYLSGRSRTYKSGQTAWQAIGRHRGGVVSTTLSTGQQGLTISLSGETPAARFLSAIVVEPSTGTFASSVQQRREQDFNEIWRIVNDPRIAPAGRTQEDIAVITPGTGTAISFTLDASTLPQHAQLSLSNSLPNAPSGHLWKNSPRLDRVSSGGMALHVSDRHLTAVAVQGVELEKGRQRFTLWIDATPSTLPGLYALELKITAPDFTRTMEIPVEVLDIRLPAALKPSGFYLDEAPHLAWGTNPVEARKRQLQCDLDFLASLGITGNAPALATPTGAPDDTFAQDTLAMRSARNALPALAYTPAKRLFENLPQSAFIELLLAADWRTRVGTKSSLIWSLADEPSNVDTTAGNLLSTAQVLKSRRPDIRLAGHFNHKGDEKFASHLDTILVNEGFGVDKKDLATLDPSKEVWLYNMTDRRLAAGLFLHHSRARRYVQWHARMPTADPFDPTDGREGDFQMFPPMAQNCPSLPDIHEDVLDLAEGLTDQRWLRWLHSLDTDRARELQARWQVSAKLGWKILSAQTDAPDRFRQEVTQLARDLKHIP